MTIAIAGTTSRTMLCAEHLRASGLFEVVWVLTPSPRRVGRTQQLTKNECHTWAEEHALATILLDKKIDNEVRNTIEQLPRPDFLLVVDFGYLVPQWLLNWPKIAPLNIHPSDLPRWRGSSPGQFALLYGDTQSAVCLMEMSAGMDEGPLFHCEHFAVNNTWTQTEYYQESFAQIAPQLPNLLSQIAAQECTATPQSETVATPPAQKLTKADSFIEWPVVSAALAEKSRVPDGAVLAQASHSHPNTASLLAHATRAFSPWPVLWTEVQTAKGTQRLQILRSRVIGSSLVIDQAKLEGKNASTWSEIEKLLV
jgi:methionyl-tRNA formyltransferase